MPKRKKGTDGVENPIKTQKEREEVAGMVDVFKPTPERVPEKRRRIGQQHCSRKGGNTRKYLKK
jgi:hypothetical protein